MVSGNFDYVSPFLIDRVLSQAIGIVNNVNKTREGLMIEIAHAKQATRPMKMKTFEQYAVTVQHHQTLNT